MKVLVTGASGTLGRTVLPRLLVDGHEVVALSRRDRAAEDVTWRRADLATGAGLSDAVVGAEAVVHLASAPYKRGYTTEVDVHGTRRLASAAAAAGVDHLLYVSIVGIDKIPFGYYRTKLAAETIVRESGVGWSILRATQFFQLMDLALSYAAKLPVMIGDPGIAGQPVDPRDVADRIARRLSAGPSGSIEEYGGPETMGFDDGVRAWLSARGKRRPLVRVTVPGKLARAFRGGHLTTAAQPTGRITWHDWLAEHYG
ncbi:MAG: SDR family oxidoreductase [Nocardioidaceae bacterium]